MKDKKYFIAVKILFYGILIINLMLIFISVNRSGTAVLISSQLTFILFICIAWVLIKRVFSVFFTNLFVMMDKMMNREGVPNFDHIDGTYMSQIYHQLNRLYDVLQMQQSSIEQEKSKVQSFVSDISHQLKTPLTNLHLLQEALKQSGISPEEYQDCLEKQGKQLDKIDFLIRALLKTSQLENGLIQIQPREASISQTILSALEGILVLAEKKEIEVYYDNSTDYTVLHDPKWTSEALFNVMENAIKYTPQNGKLNILLSRTEKYVKISIKDTGIGMSEDFVNHIFEPFERERNSTISGIQGTGLGMAITKNIVNMMNGSISVTSKQNVGSEFTVSFTFRTSLEKKESPLIPELQGCRALVVDDDFNTCDSVSYMLQQIGMRAEWTLSGKEAVLRTHQAVMREDYYAVYIIDWLLPDMNGIEVARRIQKETGGNVPIIVLTAYNWEDIEDEAKEAGVTAFCSKPLFLSELRECLHSITATEEGNDSDTDKMTSTFHAERLLLVEDNELNQEIATEILQEAGFAVEVAGNGQTAVEMLEKSTPGYYQLILMDVQMPVMNGYEATRAIRKLKNTQLASIPILAMTANAFEEDKQEALNSGMNGHIAKPINIEVLMRELNNILRPQE